MKRFLTFMLCALCAFVLESCCNSPLKYDDGPAIPKMAIKAIYTTENMNADGKLDEAVWKIAPKYSMYRPITDKIRYSKPIRDAYKGDIVEPGFAQYAWDDKFLYVAVTFTDSDLHAEGMEDQLHHYQMGDVVEIFLKPEEETFYWEIYGTPRCKRTAFRFLSRSLGGLKSSFPEKCPLEKLTVGAQVDGTLENTWDVDKGWTCEVRIPLDEICLRGGDFTQYNWRIFTCRYNYCRYIYGRPELSTVPRQYQCNYHEHGDYGWLKFVKIEKL